MGHLMYDDRSPLNTLVQGYLSSRSRPGVPVNSRPPVKPANGAVEPFKHVIDEYKHQAQTITCTCGWHGSSATVDRSGSQWTAHLFEVRGKKR
jgi:hypothetical protein